MGCLEVSKSKNGYTKIPNKLLEALAKVRIPGEAQQVLNVIIRQTLGWNKEEDGISLSQFMEKTGLPKNSVCRAKKRLHKMNLIICRKNGNRTARYRINRDNRTCKVVTKKRHVSKMNTTSHKKADETSPQNATYKRNKDTSQKKGNADFPRKVFCKFCKQEYKLNSNWGFCPNPNCKKKFYEQRLQDGTWKERLPETNNPEVEEMISKVSEAKGIPSLK